MLKQIYNANFDFDCASLRRFQFKFTSHAVTTKHKTTNIFKSKNIMLCDYACSKLYFNDIWISDFDNDRKK
jgi:hypothetical protein